MKLTVIRDCERQLESSISNLLMSQFRGSLISAGEANSPHPPDRSAVRHPLGLHAFLVLVLVLALVFIVVRLVVRLVLGLAFARVHPVELVEFVAACEFSGKGHIPHGGPFAFQAPGARRMHAGETRSIVSASHDRY